MPASREKIQVGVRLSAELVRQIDATSGNKTRAERCRDLIEAGLTGTAPAPDERMEILLHAVEALRDQLSEVRQAAVVAEQQAAKAATETNRLRIDLATAIVGVLTKIGQAVRQADERKFAREKAETFVKRVLLSDPSYAENEP